MLQFFLRLVSHLWEKYTIRVLQCQSINIEQFKLKLFNININNSFLSPHTINKKKSFINQDLFVLYFNPYKSIPITSILITSIYQHYKSSILNKVRDNNLQTFIQPQMISRPTTSSSVRVRPTSTQNTENLEDDQSIMQTEQRNQTENEQISSSCQEIQKLTPQEIEQKKQLQTVLKIIKNTKCVGGNSCYDMCSSKQCSERAIMCNDKKCQCKVNHKAPGKACFGKHDPEAIADLLQQKKNPSKPAIQQIREKFRVLRNNIDRYQNTIIGKVKQYGFVKNQLHFLQCLHNKNLDKFTGGQIHQIIEDIQDGKDKVQAIKKKLKQVVSHQLSSIMEPFKEGLKDIETNFNRIENLVYLNSKIIKKNQDQYTLKKLFRNDHQPKGFTLLYRASQHDFSVEKFRQMCDKKSHTVLLIKTKNQKIIGAYTPVMWDRSNGSYQADPNSQSFIFSISANEKFQLQNNYKSYAIQTYSEYGPVYGCGSGSNGNPNLSIADKSNLNQNSHIYDLGSDYYNGQYSTGSSNLRQMFLGQNSQNFSTLQWEVFEVMW